MLNALYYKYRVRKKKQVLNKYGLVMLDLDIPRDVR